MTHFIKAISVIDKGVVYSSGESYYTLFMRDLAKEVGVF